LEFFSESGGGLGKLPSQELGVGHEFSVTKSGEKRTFKSSKFLEKS